MMNDPKFIDPRERILPADQRAKYEARSLPELREDVFKFARRVEIVEKENNRLQSDILDLPNRYNWALGLACVSFVGVLSLLVWLVWGG